MDELTSKTSLTIIHPEQLCQFSIPGLIRDAGALGAPRIHVGRLLETALETAQMLEQLLFCVHVPVGTSQGTFVCSQKW